MQCPLSTNLPEVTLDSTIPDAKNKKNTPELAMAISFPYNTANATNVPHPKDKKVD
jgi:hypothetical protein